MALDVEPLCMRSSWLSCTMALAETTVVRALSEGWPRVLSEPEMLLEADQFAGGQEASGYGDKKHATIGEGDCRAGQD